VTRKAPDTKPLYLMKVQIETPATASVTTRRLLLPKGRVARIIRAEYFDTGAGATEVTALGLSTIRPPIPTPVVIGDVIGDPITFGEIVYGYALSTSGRYVRRDPVVRDLEPLHIYALDTLSVLVMPSGTGRAMRVVTWMEVMTATADFIEALLSQNRPLGA